MSLQELTPVGLERESLIDVADVDALEELYGELLSPPEWCDLTPDVYTISDGDEGFASVRIY